MPRRSRRSVPRRKGTDHDFTVVARRVVEQAIGERLNGGPLPDPNDGKDPDAVKRGHLGGLKGGSARARALSAKRRQEIAKAAAKKRWSE